MKVMCSNQSLEYHFQIGKTDEVNYLIRKFHYSKRIPSNVQFVGSLHKSGGLFGDNGPIVAGICFSIPPTKWSEPVLELSRLVRCESCKPPLSSLVSLSVKQLKKEGHDLLISYADETQGHKGFIYRACSWNYDGKRSERMDGIILDGKFIPGRSANSKFGTRSPTKLAELLGREVKPHFDKGKHLYWKAMTKSGKMKAQKLGLRSMPWNENHVE